MDQDIYPDGKLFNPARWLEASYPTYKEPLSVYPNCQNFHAFGYGRRSCPGSDFTERSLIIMIAKLAWGVNIYWPLDASGNEIREPMKYGPGQAPRPIKFGCRIEPRTPERIKVLQRLAENLELIQQ
jgi:pseurotin biosynthesis cytochrome P450 monooxygenase